MERTLQPLSNRVQQEKENSPSLNSFPPLPAMFKVNSTYILDEVVTGRLRASTWRVGRHPEREIVPGFEGEEEDDSDWCDEHCG